MRSAAKTEGEDAAALPSVCSGSGKAPTPYAHSVQVPGWLEGVLGGLVLCVGMLTAQVLHGTGTLVLEFGRAVRDFLQVILDVMGVVISRGGEVVQTGLDIWAHVLEWVRSNCFRVAFISVAVGLSYARWAARMSGLVDQGSAFASPMQEPAFERRKGAGKRGRRHSSPSDRAGGDSASDS